MSESSRVEPTHRQALLAIFCASEDLSEYLSSRVESNIQIGRRRWRSGSPGSRSFVAAGTDLGEAKVQVGVCAVPIGRWKPQVVRLPPSPRVAGRLRPTPSVVSADSLRKGGPYHRRKKTALARLHLAAEPLRDTIPWLLTPAHALVCGS